jgi:hypothetical protein
MKPIILTNKTGQPNIHQLGFHLTASLQSNPKLRVPFQYRT